MSKRNGIYKNCIVCGKEYYKRADRAENSKWCSSECWKNRRILNKCEYCKNDIVSYHGKKYCSRDCSHKAMVGDKSPKWIDGKSLERDRARLGPELKKWRNEVYKRDNYTCIKCDSKKDIQAHHIIHWADDETKRFDIDNGITLCIDCHGKEHGVCFKRKVKKICECGKEITRESNYCHSCSTKKQWEKRKDPKYCQVIVDRMKKLDSSIVIKKNGVIQD